MFTLWYGGALYREFFFNMNEARSIAEPLGATYTTWFETSTRNVKDIHCKMCHLKTQWRTVHVGRDVCLLDAVILLARSSLALSEYV